MHTTARYTLLASALFFLMFTLSVGKPGLPVTLKADEPAYFLMALSLVEDGDLVCGPEDFRRAIDSYPYLPTDNLILMTDRDGGSVRFGKPLIYPLLAAPLAAVFGANGLVAFNALLLLTMIVLGALYLRRFNSDGEATLFSAAFFLLSPSFHYVFWLQPEILNMASASACLFFAFHRFDAAPAGGWWRRWASRVFNETTAPWWSAACLAPGTYNKPVLALIGVPALIAITHRRGLRYAGGWLLAAVLAMAAIVGGSVLFTGHPTPYLGVIRTGLRVEDPAAMGPVVEDAFARVTARSATGNAWSWIFRLPTFNVRELAENIGYFLWGRHTGFLLYLPFAVASLVLFLVHQRRSLERWLLLAATAAIALFFLLFTPLTWHGGGGFIGNRYFIMAYPAFLFLVTSLRPLWILPSAAALAGAFLGTILFTPFGAPVAEPTLQSHVRGGLYKHFPLELSLRLTVPGYNYMGQSRALLIGRKDVFRTHRPDRPYVWLDAVTRNRLPLTGPLDGSAAWLYGATTSNILILAEDPIDGLFLEVTTWVPDNTVRFDFGGTKEEVVFEDALSADDRSRVLELKPRAHERVHWERGKRMLVYELDVSPATGRRVVARQDETKQFYLGAELRYLARRDQVGRSEHYRIEWLEATPPEVVTSGTLTQIPVSVRNSSASPLGSDELFPVYLSYHWLDEGGNVVVFDGRRTPVRPSIPPRESAALPLKVMTPSEPGRYTLVLDAVRENVAWFSEQGGATRELEITVIPGDRDVSSDTDG